MEGSKLIDLQTGGMHDLLPPNFKDDDRFRAAFYAMDRLIQKVFTRLEKTVTWSNIEGVSEEVADYLAAELRTPFYDVSLPLETKRLMVANTLSWYSRLGTKDVIEEIIRIVLGSGEVSEWFEYGGKPYCFRLTTDTVIDSREKLQALIQAVFQVKNTRSWLEAITRQQEANATVYTGIVVKHIRKNAIRAEEMHKHTINTQTYTGVAVKHIRRSIIPCRVGGELYGV